MMEQLAVSRPQANGVALRALNQAARELMLAQASDWAFMMATVTIMFLAASRIKDHLLIFNRRGVDF
jgi:1,4-alpha-glucan branching enzyme